MSDEIAKASQLYHRYGLQKASFIAFNHMQESSDQQHNDYWLSVINHIALIDLNLLTSEESASQTS